MSNSAVVAPDAKAAALRLANFQVIKLFNEFNYNIPLNLEGRVTAVIAPNGTGKTLCLRMINSFFESRWSIFSDTVFESVRFDFSNGSIVVINKDDQEKEGDEPVFEANFEIRIYKTRLGPPEVWRPRFGDPRRNLIPERYLPFLTRLGANKWRNDHSGRVLNLADVMDQYHHVLPASFRAMAYGKKPDALASIINSVDCRLIETQRLLVFQGNQEELNYYPGNVNKTSLAIAKKAETLKEIMSREIGAYATLSQNLDRSFPRRVIAQQFSLPVEDLQKQLKELDDKRRELMEVGILDSGVEEQVTLPDGGFEGTISRVLSVYADDTKQKLSSLSGILKKITLFKELIDKRFLTKDVLISKSTGIDVHSQGHSVPLEKLSSGEQHQLVLFFELLFEIKEDALILIDEPELSLHVAWQKKFIGDLMRIIELNKFDVVLATHSPQLVGRWNKLVVELGPVDDEEEGAIGQTKVIGNVVNH